VALEKHPQREIRFVAVKENENTTTRCGCLLLQPRRDVRQVSICRRVHVVSRHLANDRAKVGKYLTACWAHNLLNISRIFLKYGHFSYDGVNYQHMFTKQRFIAY
jgi:hypothetical protein